MTDPHLAPVPTPNHTGNREWPIHFKGMEYEDIRRSFLGNLEYSIAKDQFTFTSHDQYLSMAYSIRERLIERWILTQQAYHKGNCKRVYYLSFEFLLGRLLSDSAINLGIMDQCREVCSHLGLKFDELEEQEPDAGLGNGGLGRLAACFLDSMATLELPVTGYGIRYEFGIFKQELVDGAQHEVPEEWLQFGNPWEIERREYRLEINYYGKVAHPNGVDFRLPAQWTNTLTVLAVPFDTPVPGFRNNTVNTLRLWSAQSKNEFDLADFNRGDYIGACHDKMTSENISKVLYPNDNNHSGRELRLKQQFFFTSASLQDIIRRYLKHNPDFSRFHKKVAIQLNDTHPAIAIVELMRLLVDVYQVRWARAWGIVGKTFGYTNHTLLPEALEKWPVKLMQELLPRHMEIIYEINKYFLRKVAAKYPGDSARLQRMSFIEEGREPLVRMAHLAIAGSHSVNGVSALHSSLLTQGLFRDFYELWPERFNNKTNGITPRRWLLKSNPVLSDLITQTIGSGWLSDLTELKKLAPFADDPGFRSRWMEVKATNKHLFVKKIKQWEGITIDPKTLFDVQVKRIHEYKRQLLNTMHCIYLYNEIKAGRTAGFVPRSVIIGGKAAPGYFQAKLIIRFINAVAEAINNDPDTTGLLEVHFIPNYRVTMAEFLIPATDLSEQISTAGKEASGTGNMKFALNGAVTIGTRDGANIEMCEEIGEEHMFMFGLEADQIDQMVHNGYNPREYYQNSPRLAHVLNLIRDGFFNPANEPGLFMPLYVSLVDGGDPFMLCADFDTYIDCHARVSEAYRDIDRWARMSILNAAGSGHFSSDRTIRQYAGEIWGVKSTPIPLDR